jgi:hypothetical protein
VGPENGTEQRSALRSPSASCPWGSAASASSAASSLVASCRCSAESRCMRGAARRTRSLGTRSCIAFFRPVEDQTHTKVWSEGRAVQPPHAGRLSRPSPNEGRVERVLITSRCGFFCRARVICQRFVSRVSAAIPPQAVLSPAGRASASATHPAGQYGDSARRPTPRSRACRRRCRSGHLRLDGRRRARATRGGSAWPNLRANKPPAGAQRHRTTHPSGRPRSRAASRLPPGPRALAHGIRRSARQPPCGRGATHGAAETPAARRPRQSDEIWSSRRPPSSVNSHTTTPWRRDRASRPSVMSASSCGRNRREVQEP